MSKDISMDAKLELPKGAKVLDVGPTKGQRDPKLARSLARLGASSMLIRVVGGEDVVREAEASASRTHPLTG